MKYLSIDIETYSSVDISKAGLYKYVQSFDFAILLFAYSVDGGPVQIVDLAQGEEIPPDIISALPSTHIMLPLNSIAYQSITQPPFISGAVPWCKACTAVILLDFLR